MEVIFKQFHIRESFGNEQSMTFNKKKESMIGKRGFICRDDNSKDGVDQSLITDMVGLVKFENRYQDGKLSTSRKENSKIYSKDNLNKSKKKFISDFFGSEINPDFNRNVGQLKR